MSEELLSDKLTRWGIYREFTFKKVWCYKQQFPYQDVIIVSDKDLEKAASKFFIEFLKSLHYSILSISEKDDSSYLSGFIENMKRLDDENINKTIEIAMRFSPTK